MKRILSARFFLVIFITSISQSCINNHQKTSVSEAVLDNLSEKLTYKDYADPENLGFTNPHEALGATTLKMVKALQAKLDEERNLPTPSRPKTFGILDEKVVEVVRAIGPDVFRSEGREFDSQHFEKINKGLNEYSFSSDGVMALLNEAEKGGNLTPFQRRIVQMEFQEFARAKSERQVRSICATVEQEIINSGLELSEADAILKLNAVLRNLSELQLTETTGLNEVFSFDQKVMQFTTPVIITTVLVFFAVTLIISLVFCDDPGFAAVMGGSNCYQNTIAYGSFIGFTVGFVAEGVLRENNTDYEP
jgi:hypothetical protein